MGFRKDDKVWDVRRGNGVVSKRRNGERTYPVRVNFEGGDFSTYTDDGKYDVDNKNRCLFHGHDLEVKGETEPVRLPTKACVNIYPDGHHRFHTDKQAASMVGGKNAVTYEFDITNMKKVSE